MTQAETIADLLIPIVAPLDDDTMAEAINLTRDFACGVIGGETGVRFCRDRGIPVLVMVDEIEELAYQAASEEYRVSSRAINKEYFHRGFHLGINRSLA